MDVYETTSHIVVKTIVAGVKKVLPTKKGLMRVITVVVNQSFKYNLEDVIDIIKAKKELEDELKLGEVDA